MSDPAVAVQRQQVRQQGLIAGLITLPFRLFGVLAGSLVLCIAIECIGMHFFWPEQGWRHAQGMLNYELSQVSEHFTQSVLVQEPGRSALQLVEWAYQGLFEPPRFLRRLLRLRRWSHHEEVTEVFTRGHRARSAHGVRCQGPVPIAVGGH